MDSGFKPVLDETGPACVFALGTADDILNEAVSLPSAVRDFLATHEVYGRLPSIGSADVKVDLALPPSVTQPIEPGNDVVAGNSDASGESSKIANWLESTQRLAGKRSQNPLRIAQVLMGADFQDGTSGLRTFSEFAARFAPGDTPMHLTLLTKPCAGPMPWVRAPDAEAEAVEVKLVSTNGAPQGPRKLGWMPGRWKPRAANPPAPAAEKQVRIEDILAARPSHRSDWMIRGLVQAPHAFVDIVQVDPGAPKSIDAKLRKLAAIKSYVAAKGTAGGAGVEVKRIQRAVGPLAIGSYLADVIEVSNAHTVTGMHRQLRRPLLTLGGYYVVPGDRGEDGTTRQAVMLGLGNPSALVRLGKAVKDGMGIDDDCWTECCAPANIDGAIACVWVEADLSDIEGTETRRGNYPDLVAHPWWPAVEQAKMAERRRMAERDGEKGGSA